MAGDIDSADVVAALENADDRERQRIINALGMGTSRREFMKAAGGLGAGALIGGGAANAVTGSAKADPSTSDGDGNIGLPDDRVDVFAEGIDSNSLDTGRMLTGDSLASAQSDVAVYLDGSEAVAVQPSGEIARSTSHGTVIQQALNALSRDDVCQIAPGSYGSSDVDPIETPTVQDLDVLADGAVIDSTFRVRDHGCGVRGLKVDGAAGNGFEFQRGQSGYFENLKAENCGNHGFLVGGKQDWQVAYSVWMNCHADANSGDGVVVDGSNTNNWVNANLFNFKSRGNTGNGIVHKGAAHYNTYSAPQVESNGDPQGSALKILDSNENLILGPHVVTPGTWSLEGAGTAARNMAIGGRTPQGVTGMFDQTQGQFRPDVMAEWLHVADGSTAKITQAQGASGGSQRRTQGTTSVGTAATPIYSLVGGQAGSLIVVQGYDPSSTSDRFCDVIHRVATATPTTISSQEQGTPASRSYSYNSGNIELAMGSSTYDVASSGTEVGSDI